MMGYSSADEGEIVQDSGDKATRTRPSNRDSAVDRRSRPRSPLSRSSRPHSPSSRFSRRHSPSSRYNRPQSPSSRYNRPHSPSSNYPHKRRYPSDARHELRYDDGDRHDLRYDNANRHDLRYDDGEGRHEPPKKQRRSNRSPSPARRHDKRVEFAVPAQEKDQAPDEPVVDEVELIQERRKRREALRAKHRILSESAHPSPSPSHPSPPQSITNGHQVAVSISAPDGPSAPDHDAVMDIDPPAVDSNRTKDTDAPAVDPNPTMDTDAPAVDYDETKEKDDGQIVVPATAPNELDMFAEDDEDDMFALEPQVGHKKEDGTQAVRIPEAKQLDRSLLDDWDDPEGYYRIILGELLDGRYHVQTNLGKGVFSAVVRALDTKSDRVVAIKIIRTQESMYKAGMKEIEILQEIADADPDDKKHVIRLERHFEHKGHLCMVFENLSENLREVLKKFGRDIGINIKAVRSYAQQMFLGLGLLKKCQILHADLKPDNVLVNEARSLLKIADLGSAMSADDNEITDVLVSRFYRAPEIMLGIRHDYAIDMWSIGCTLFELYTGKICFTGSTNNQMLKGIIECRGKIPNRMLKRSEFWPQHFDPDGTFLSHEVDNVTRREVVRRINITRTVPTKELKSRLYGNAKGLSPADAKELNLFADLLDKCLALDPTRRITPTDALKHPFIHRTVPQSLK